MAESFWMGKPLSEYSKPELIGIIEDLALANRQDSLEHMRQLDILFPRKRA